MTRFAYIFAIAVFIIPAPGPARADIASIEDATAEKVMGNADAPVTMIEYSSLSCPHCAAFHRDSLPKIKKTYIDTGKVKLIYRDFPFGGLAMAGAMVARCAGSKKYFGMIDILFRSQEDWTRGKNPLADIKRVARFGGMSESDVEKCLADEPLMQAIQKRQKEGETEYGVNSTPTFFINGIEVKGALPFEEYKKVIDKALKKLN
ncbi:MAG: DsbA family protein [Rhodospirillales bacterium]